MLRIYRLCEGRVCNDKTPNPYFGGKVEQSCLKRNAAEARNDAKSGPRNAKKARIAYKICCEQTK